MRPSPSKTNATDGLLELCDVRRCELIDGRLVEKKSSYLSSVVSGQVACQLGTYLHDRPLGTVAGSRASYRCVPDDSLKVRRPSVTFVARGRLPVEELARGHVTVAPDLAVEVVSPNDTVYELNKKVQEYLRAGVRLVWVIDPENRTLVVYRANRTLAEFKPEDELTGEDVIPGFRCLVRDFFQPLDLLAKPTAT